MKKMIKGIWILVAAAGCGCGDFDDSALRDRIDSYKNRIEVLQEKAAGLQTQLNDLSQLTNGNVITSVSQDSDGKFIVTYKDDSDQEYSVVLATMDEMLDIPVLGVALDEEEGVYYWTQTVDGETSWLLKGENGERIPVRGNTPALSVDDEGYWTVNGERLVDAAGNPIGAEDGSSSIFREASYEEGIFSLTLGNGEKLTIPVFNTLNLKLGAPAQVTIVEPSAGYRITYELSGEAQAEALVAVAKEYGGAKAEVNTAEQCIDVTFDASFSDRSDAHIIVMAYDLENHVVVKPVFFTTSTTSQITISSKEELLQFAANVNAGAVPAGMEVLLTADIDMAGVTEWTPIGNATLNAASNVGSMEITGGYPFTGIFDGGGHIIRNLNLSFENATDNQTFGLFGVIKGAEIRNLQIGEESEAESSSLHVRTPASIWAGVLVGVAIDSKISDCTSYASIDYDSTSASSARAFVGMVGCCFSDTKETWLDQVKNYGPVEANVHGNTSNNLSAAPHIGGICALTSANSDNKQMNHVDYCANYGDIISDSARTAGVVGAANSYTAFNSCFNYGNQTNTVGDTGRLGGISVILGTGSQ